MKKSKFSEEQIVFALKQAENGTIIDEICRKLGKTQSTFYNWKKKYGGLLLSEVRRLRQLEEENRREYFRNDLNETFIFLREKRDSEHLSLLFRVFT